MIALLAQLGGLGISIPTRSANRQQVSCEQVTVPLVDLINSNAMNYPRGVQQEQKEMNAKVQSRNCEKAAEEAEAVSDLRAVISDIGKKHGYEYLNQEQLSPIEKLYSGNFNLLFLLHSSG